jgi:hypothetical protein
MPSANNIRQFFFSFFLATRYSLFNNAPLKLFSEKDSFLFIDHNVSCKDDIFQY